MQGMEGVRDGGLGTWIQRILGKGPARAPIKVRDAILRDMPTNDTLRWGMFDLEFSFIADPRVYFLKSTANMKTP